MDNPAFTPYLETIVNLGGVLTTAGEAIAKLRADGFDDIQIGLWLSGALHRNRIEEMKKNGYHRFYS